MPELYVSGAAQMPQGDGGVELYNAIQNGSRNAVRDILKRGQNPDVVLKTSSRLTGLTYATIKGHNGIVRDLIKCRASLNLKDKLGMTAAMYACVYNNKDIVRLFMQAGADLSLSDNDGKTALHHAAQSGSLECLDFLLDDANLDDINGVDSQGKSAVMYAACCDHIACLKRSLMQEGIDKDLVDNDGNSPLISAVHLRKIDHASILLKKGAEVNIVNNKGKTALSKAFEQNKNEQMLELAYKLLAYGARPNVNPTDELFLHEIIARGQKKMVQLMLINGCSPRMRACKENIFKFHFLEELSPLAVALLSNEHSIARYLLANVFLTKCDITSLPYSRDIAIFLGRNHLNHCGSLLKAISFNPFPLFVLGIRAVLSLLYDKDYKYKVLSQQSILATLPTILRDKLQFRSNLAYLCVHEWETMPLMIEMVTGQEFPAPRPLSFVWPIGHKLTKCRFDCCANSQRASFRIVKTEPVVDGEENGE